MAGTTPNLELITWDENDQFDEADLNANWTILDTEVDARLYRNAPDTLSSTVTVTGTIQFGSSNSIAFTQASVTDNVNYAAVKIAGPVLIHASDTATDTAFAIKMDADPLNDDDFRFKINQVGKHYWGDGTEYDVSLGRDTNGDLVVELGDDVDAATTHVIATSSGKRNYTGIGLTGNYIWNGTFDIDTDGQPPIGWFLKELHANVGTSAGASVTTITEGGSKKLQFTADTDAELDGAVVFPIDTVFKAGVEYTGKAWLKRPDGGVIAIAADIGFANSTGVFAESANTTLTTTAQLLTVTWTPVSDVGPTNPVHFFIRSESAFQGPIVADNVAVYPTSAVAYSEDFPLVETMPRYFIADDETGNADLYYTIDLYAISVEKGTIARTINVLMAEESGMMETGLSDNIWAGIYRAGYIDTFPTAPSTNPTPLPWELTRVAQVSNAMHYQGLGRPLKFTLATPYRFTESGLYYLAFWREDGTQIPVRGKNISTIQVYDTGFPLSLKVTNDLDLADEGDLPDLISVDENFTITLGTVYPYAWIT